MTSTSQTQEAFPTILVLLDAKKTVGVMTATQGTRDYISNILRYRLKTLYSECKNEGQKSIRFVAHSDEPFEELLAAIYGAAYLRIVGEVTVVEQIMSGNLTRLIAEAFPILLDMEESIKPDDLEYYREHFGDDVIPGSVRVKFQIYNIRLAEVASDYIHTIIHNACMRTASELAVEKHQENAEYYMVDTQLGGRLSNLVAKWVTEAELALHEAQALSAGKTTDPETVAQTLEELKQLQADLLAGVAEFNALAAKTVASAQKVLATYQEMRHTENALNLRQLLVQIEAEFKVLKADRTEVIDKANSLANDLKRPIIHKLEIIRRYAEAARQYVLEVVQEDGGEGKK